MDIKMPTHEQCTTPVKEPGEEEETRLESHTHKYKSLSDDCTIPKITQIEEEEEETFPISDFKQAKKYTHIFMVARAIICKQETAIFYHPLCKKCTGQDLWTSFLHFHFLLWLKFCIN